MSGFDAAATAAAALERAFLLQEDWSKNASQPRIGIFGNGMPETLIAAAGALPVHVWLGTTSDHHPIEDIIEPFVDDEVRHFLVKLMRGAYADFAGIVFARDDAPALIAYQYATEWIRQDRDRKGVPPLFLWNLVHTSTPAVAKFNKIQAEALFTFFETVGLSNPKDAELSAAAQEEDARNAALRELKKTVGHTRSGATAARWRNAGRFMSAAEHADLIKSALDARPYTVKYRERIGVVGSPLSCRKVYAMIEQFGTVVCDQQSLGQVWPGPGNAKSRLEDILTATAADPSCHRIAPTRAYRAALVENIVSTGCTVAICQLAQTDDTFGWEVPALFEELSAHGITCINLGFRDTRPDDAWLDTSANLIKTSLEARK